MHEHAPSSLPAFARRLPFFYGWLIVAVILLSGFIGSGLNNVAMGVVFKPMSEDLGWSRSLTTGAITAGTIVGGFSAFFLGRLADRVGPRALLPAGAAAAGALTLLVSLVTQPWHFYAAYVPARAAVQTLLFGVVPMTALANWFYRKRPRVLGLLAMIVPLGASALAILYHVLIVNFGWRAVFVALALLLWIFVVVPGALILRRRPEDVGLQPDGVQGVGERGSGGAGEGGRGDAETRRRGEGTPHSLGGRGAGGEGDQEAQTRRRAAVHAELSWSLQEALRTRALWLVTFSATLGIICTGGIGFHQVAYYTDVGIDPLLAAAALSVFGITGAFANGLWGFLAERVSGRALFIGCMLLSAVGALLLIQVRSPLLAFAASAMLGLTARGQESLLQILLAQYYGRVSFGSISGFVEIIYRPGLGIGPLVAAAVFDLTGSYEGAFLGFIGAFLMAMLLLLLARRPVLRRERTATSN